MKRKAREPAARHHQAVDEESAYQQPRQVQGVAPVAPARSVCELNAGCSAPTMANQG
jgi:hypothetical protein